MKIVKRLFISLSVVMLFSAAMSYAESPVNENSNTTMLTLNADLVMEVEFSSNIANVTKSIPSALLQVETLGNRMFLLAKENFESQIYVVTQDNISYCLHLVVSEAKDIPGHVKIKKPFESASEPRNRTNLNTIKLMKALITGEGLSNAALSKAKNDEIFNDGSLRIVIDRIYEFPSGVKAVVLTVENLTLKPVVVPIEHIQFPGLLAISIQSQMLEASSRLAYKKAAGVTTKAYMIIEGAK